MKLPSWINLEWRTPKLLIALAVLELPFTVAALALVGIADPDTYRSQLWLEGSKHDWNSDPIEILYAFANYRPIPVPTPWNQFITNYNVVIVVLSMFIMLVKCVMFITHVFPPFLSAIIHSILIVLYSISIAHQSASDYSDPLRPSKTPWYITKGCGDPVAPKLRGFCMQARGTFVVVVMLCVIFVLFLILSLVSCFPTAAMRAAQHPNFSDAASPVSTYDDKKWEIEMNQWPQTPGTSGGMKSPTVPMTPRTMAFNTLDGTLGTRRPNRDLPLRHHISMGSETYKGKGVK